MTRKVPGIKCDLAKDLLESRRGLRLERFDGPKGNLYSIFEDFLQWGSRGGGEGKPIIVSTLLISF
jgi:hypothetical protein